MSNHDRPERSSTKGPRTSQPMRGESVARQSEWEKDLLIALASAAEAHRTDAPAYADPRFLDWLARDLREREGGREEAVVAGVVSALRARVAAARSSLRLVDCRAETRPAVEVGPVARVLDRAAASGCAPVLDLAIAAGAGRELWDEECESWIALPDELPSGRFVALTVSGDSMTPLMHSGDVVLVKLGAELSRDSVVVARRPDDGYVVKRVGRLDRGSVELLSLNPAFPPLRIERRDELIVGTVVVRWCAHAGSATTASGH